MAEYKSIVDAYRDKSGMSYVIYNKYTFKQMWNWLTKNYNATLHDDGAVTLEAK